MKGLKKLFRAIQDRREESFSRRRALIPFGQDLVEVEPSVYHGPDVKLRSGVVVHEGAKIADLHLNSRRTRQYFNEPPVKARLRLYRDAVAALREAAAWLENDPRGKDVQALRCVTLLTDNVERLGFEVSPLPLWPWVFVGAHMRWLEYLYGDERGPGREGGRLLQSLAPSQGWISREDFVRRYRA